MVVIPLLAFVALVPLALAHSRPDFNDGGINLGQQKGFFEGDILWTPKALKNRNAIFKSQRWTNGIVPYFINPESVRDWYTAEHVQMIEDAIKEIEKHTCIRFVPYTDQENFMKIHAGPACYTHGVGMSPGVNWVVLSSASCMVHRIVIHELMHALGLHHEQSRYDRDEYLTIHYNRLPGNGTDEYSNFQLRIVPETESTFYGIPYNYASVMHYDAWSLGDGAPGSFVMEPKNLGMLSVMGFSKTANETDYEKLRRLYDCEGSYPVVPPAEIPCVDEDNWNDCNETYDYCDKDRTTIHNCRKTCGYCVWGQEPLKKQRPCKDWRDDCAHFKDRCDIEWWLPRKCALTCGKCQAGGFEEVPVSPGGPGVQATTEAVTEEPIPTNPPRPGCEDTITYCNDWKHDCGKAEWMNEACRHTCNLC